MSGGDQETAPAASAGVELPLFPLTAVLLPGGTLQLRIFEPRYVDMIGRCMREGEAFGVVRILEGGDTGATGARRLAVAGTSARIVDFDTLPDGLLGISCVGERCFRVLERWQRADGLHMARVQWLPPADLPTDPQQLAALLAQ